MTFEAPTGGPSIACIAGGVGAARMLRGLVRVSNQVTAVANVGDDVELHGLHISPDLDTVTYTLADRIDPTRSPRPYRRTTDERWCRGRRASV